MSTKFAVSVEYAKKALLVEDFELHNKQLEALKSIYDGKDTVVVLPTGSGKSIIFQLLPWLLQGAADSPKIVIIISPVTSLMQDQVASLYEKGVPACYITIDGLALHGYSRSDVDNCQISTNVPMDEIIQGHIKLIYMHPETVFEKGVGNILRSKLFKEMVCCTVIDEAHMISEWGPSFRGAFFNLGDLTCLFPRIPHLALTATATPESVVGITTQLNFHLYNTIIANPDRPNIYIQLKERLPNINKYEKHDSICKDILLQLQESTIEYPPTIVYCDNLESLGYCFQYIMYELGDRAYVPVGSDIPENRIIAMFHKGYTEKMKSHIVSEIRKENPKIRLVLATVSLGMGLNSPCISRGIHMRPPTTLEKYLQEMGRAGRDGKDSSSICYYNKSDIACNRKGLDYAMRQFILNKSSCLRKDLVKYFGFEDVLFKGPASKCCSNCNQVQ